MRENPTTTKAPEFLRGWRAIASHLGMGVRTVQRYESELGLPVQRKASKPRGLVVATKRDLDAWATVHLAMPAPEAPVSPMASVERIAAEVKRLRGEMTALRSEMKASISELAERMHRLCSERAPDCKAPD